MTEFFAEAWHVFSDPAHVIAHLAWATLAGLWLKFWHHPRHHD